MMMMMMMDESDLTIDSAKGLAAIVARSVRAHECESGWLVLFPPLAEGSVWMAPRSMGTAMAAKGETDDEEGEPAIRVARRAEHACFTVVLTEAVREIRAARGGMTPAVVARDGRVRWMPNPFDGVRAPWA